MGDALHRVQPEALDVRGADEVRRQSGCPAEAAVDSASTRLPPDASAEINPLCILPLCARSAHCSCAFRHRSWAPRSGPRRRAALPERRKPSGSDSAAATRPMSSGAARRGRREPPPKSPATPETRPRGRPPVSAAAAVGRRGALPGALAGRIHAARRLRRGRRRRGEGWLSAGLAGRRVGEARRGLSLPASASRLWRWLGACAERRLRARRRWRRRVAGRRRPPGGRAQSAGLAGSS